MIELYDASLNIRTQISKQEFEKNSTGDKEVNGLFLYA